MSEEMKFCFLKGIVDCPAGTVQDCNIKHVNKCKLEEKKNTQKQENKEPVFCFLKGVVDCPPSRVQDCNIKHVNQCMLES